MCLSAALLPCAELLGVFAMVAVDHDTFDDSFMWLWRLLYSQSLLCNLGCKDMSTRFDNQLN